MEIVNLFRVLRIFIKCFGSFGWMIFFILLCWTVSINAVGNYHQVVHPHHEQTNHPTNTHDINHHLASAPSRIIDENPSPDGKDNGLPNVLHPLEDAAGNNVIENPPFGGNGNDLPFGSIAHNHNGPEVHTANNAMFGGDNNLHQNIVFPQDGQSMEHKPDQHKPIIGNPHIPYIPPPPPRPLSSSKDEFQPLMNSKTIPSNDPPPPPCQVSSHLGQTSLRDDRVSPCQTSLDSNPLPPQYTMQYDVFFDKNNPSRETDTLLNLQLSKKTPPETTTQMWSSSAQSLLQHNQFFHQTPPHNSDTTESSDVENAQPKDDRPPQHQTEHIILKEQPPPGKGLHEKLPSSLQAPVQPKNHPPLLQCSFEEADRCGFVKSGRPWILIGGNGQSGLGDHTIGSSQGHYIQATWAGHPSADVIFHVKQVVKNIQQQPSCLTFWHYVTFGATVGIYVLSGGQKRQLTVIPGHQTVDDNGTWSPWFVSLPITDGMMISFEAQSHLPRGKAALDDISLQLGPCIRRDAQHDQQDPFDVQTQTIPPATPRSTSTGGISATIDAFGSTPENSSTPEPSVANSTRITEIDDSEWAIPLSIGLAVLVFGLGSVLVCLWWRLKRLSELRNRSELGHSSYKGTVTFEGQRSVRDKLKIEEEMLSYDLKKSSRRPAPRAPFELSERNGHLNRQEDSCRQSTSGIQETRLWTVDGERSTHANGEIARSSSEVPQTSEHTQGVIVPVRPSRRAKKAGGKVGQITTVNVSQNKRQIPKTFEDQDRTTREFGIVVNDQRDPTILETERRPHKLSISTSFNAQDVVTKSRDKEFLKQSLSVDSHMNKVLSEDTVFSDDVKDKFETVDDLSQIGANGIDTSRSLNVAALKEYTREMATEKTPGCDEHEPNNEKKDKYILSGNNEYAEYANIRYFGKHKLHSLDSETVIVPSEYEVQRQHFGTHASEADHIESAAIQICKRPSMNNKESEYGDATSSRQESLGTSYDEKPKSATVPRYRQQSSVHSRDIFTKVEVHDNPPKLYVLTNENNRSVSGSIPSIILHSEPEDHIMDVDALSTKTTSTSRSSSPRLSRLPRANNPFMIEVDRPKIRRKSAPSMTTRKSPNFDEVGADRLIRSVSGDTWASQDDSHKSGLEGIEPNVSRSWSSEIYDYLQRSSSNDPLSAERVKKIINDRYDALFKNKTLEPSSPSYLGEPRGSPLSLSPRSVKRRDANKASRRVSQESKRSEDSSSSHSLHSLDLPSLPVTTEGAAGRRNISPDNIKFYHNKDMLLEESVRKTVATEAGGSKQFQNDTEVFAMPKEDSLYRDRQELANGNNGIDTYSVSDSSSLRRPESESPETIMRRIDGHEESSTGFESEGYDYNFTNMDRVFDKSHFQTPLPSIAEPQERGLGSKKAKVFHDNASDRQEYSDVNKLEAPENAEAKQYIITASIVDEFVSVTFDGTSHGPEENSVQLRPKHVRKMDNINTSEDFEKTEISDSTTPKKPVRTKRMGRLRAASTPTVQKISMNTKRLSIGDWVSFDKSMDIPSEKDEFLAFEARPTSKDCDWGVDDSVQTVPHMSFEYDPVDEDFEMDLKIRSESSAAGSDWIETDDIDSESVLNYSDDDSDIFGIPNDRRGSVSFLTSANKIPLLHQSSLDDSAVESQKSDRSGRPSSLRSVTAVRTSEQVIPQGFRKTKRASIQSENLEISDV